MNLHDFIQTLPKVELHDHLDGGLRPTTIIEMAQATGYKLPSENPDELGAWFRRGADRHSLPLYLEGFGVTCALMQTTEALERVAFEAMEDLAAQNVVYAEIRFAPILSTAGGLNLEEIVESVLSGLKRGKEKTGMRFGLILCALRNMDSRVSLETAELAVAYRDRGVVGFDIAGDENGHPPKRHLEAFQFIRDRNFHITIHAGEAFGPESIWQALQVCGAHRIGHGTRLVEDMVVSGTNIQKMGSLAEFVRNMRIPLECCLSSNIQTGAAASLETHPFAALYKNNFRVMLCSDNRLMSGTDLSHEMELAVRTYGFDCADLEKLTVNAMKSAFLGYEERVKVIYDVIKPRYARAKEMREAPI
jgi:adenosine deaminase